MNPTTDRTNVSQSGYTYGGQNYTYQTRTDGNGNPYQVAVTTSAPTGQTSTSSPVSSPVAVNSSNPALNDYNNRVLPGFQDLNSKLTANTQTLTPGNRPGDNVYTPTDPKNPVVGPDNGFLGYRGYDGNTYATKDEALSKKYKGGDGQYYSTQEEAVMNTPADGHLFAYDASGQRTTIKNGEQLPQGYSLTPPQSAQNQPVVESVDDSFGGSIRKLADGTYAQYDNNGQRTGGSNQAAFNNLKVLNKTTQDILDAQNSYTLSAGEKAQIDSLKAMYQKAINETQTQYGNLAGSQAILQNLYGMGNNTIGQGEITGVVTKGIKAVADLNVEMEGKVAQMTQAFKDKNIESLRNLYNDYSNKEKLRQEAITHTSDQLSLISREAQQQKATAENALTNDINTFQTEVSKVGGPSDPVAYAKALANRDYAGMVEAAGNVITSGIAGEYNTYKRDELARGTPPAQIMSFNKYQTADANRKATIARAGAAIASGTDMTTKQQAIFNTIVQQQNKSPLIMANDRAVILKSITDEVSKDPSNAALQVSFIYSMIQALDTYQSAVREGEINLVEGTQGLGEKLNNLPSKIEKGNPLNPSKIAEYVKVSKTLTDSISNATQQKKNTFKAQATINGIGKQYSDWDTLTGQLNEKTIGGEHKDNTKNDPLGVGTKGSTSTKNPLGI